MFSVSSLRVALVAAFACVLLSGCKEDTLVGSNIIPGGDFLNGTFTDTLTLRTVTVKEDSLRTHNLERYLLGAMQDDMFGKSYAGVYTQLRLTSYGLDFDASAGVDSAVLSLAYAGYYGDKTTPHSVRVYRMVQPLALNADSTVYSDQTFAVGTEIGQKLNFLVNTDSSYHEGDSTFAPQLRIPLDASFAQDILNQDPAGAFKDNASFQAYLNGLYVAPDSASWAKGMMYVNPRNGESSLTIYYHDANGSGKKFKLFMNGTAENSNYFKHNYTGMPVQTALNNPGNDSLLFVQSMAGVKGKITVPYLHNLGNVLINKAEVEITQRVVGNETYDPPTNMFVIAADSNGRNSVLTDQLFSTGVGLPAYGGTAVSETVNGVTYKRYRISIAAQLQLILNNKITDYGLFLVNGSSNSKAERVVVGGGNSVGSYQMKLNLAYTKIP